MDIHEYQAKNILKKYGIPSPEFFLVKEKEEVKQGAAERGWKQGILKVQVHAGGRGKAGGVKIAKTNEEMDLFAGQLLGMKLINNQTGSRGIIVSKLIVSPLVPIIKEYYLSAVIDRKSAQPFLIASFEGGVEIEEVARLYPDKILKIPILQDGNIRSYHLMNFINFMGWEGETAKQGKMIALAISRAFIETDSLLIELNPLVKTEDGKLVALDAKMSVDDNALFRQPEIAALYDPTQISSGEVEAKNYDLAYVALEGNIGCMVNGAGLAMATMDIIQLSGGKPANFLDVGGGATQEKVAAGFKIILSDSNVKAILVNIFGGIMNCKTLASGIILAASELNVKVPLVIRMEGTNVDEGKKMLSDSGLDITIATSLSDAAEKVVKAAKGVN